VLAFGCPKRAIKEGSPVRIRHGPAAVSEDETRKEATASKEQYESMREGAGTRMIRESEDLPNGP